MNNARWNNEPTCPYCGSINTARNQHRHRCYDCKTSFSVTVGTIFHHTHLSLQKWFLAVMLMLNAKKGLSVLQLSRDLDVNKNTAWRIAMQIRKAMTQAKHRNLLTDIVEMDETYIGGIGFELIKDRLENFPLSSISKTNSFATTLFSGNGTTSSMPINFRDKMYYLFLSRYLRGCLKTSLLIFNDKKSNLLMEASSLKEEKEIVDTMGCLGIVRVFADNVFDGKSARQLITVLFSFLHTIKKSG